MTETTRFVSKRTAVLLLLLIAAIVVLMTWMAQEQYVHEYTRDCMSALVTPKPYDPAYDRLSLEFASDVRGCMRG